MEEEKMIGDGKKFQKIRRITGYLVGDVRRFNNAKFSEVQDRVKHQLGNNNVIKTFN